MSIRDIQLSDLGEMQVSIELAKYLLLKRVERVNYVMRCRLEVLMALQYGCKQLSKDRGYTVECYGNDVYKNVDFLSDRCQDVKMLVHFFNAMHPDCDFARIEISSGEFDKAYQILDFYIELLDSMYRQLRDNRKFMNVEEDNSIEHILQNLGERVDKQEVWKSLPNDFTLLSRDAQVQLVKEVCATL